MEGVVYMAKKEVNPVIWDEVEGYPMDGDIRAFLKELLLFERKHISERSPRYSEEYDKSIERYSEKMEESESE